MIVYPATKATFADDVLDDRIDPKIYDFFKKQLDRNTSAKEIVSLTIIPKRGDFDTRLFYCKIWV